MCDCAMVINGKITPEIYVPKKKHEFFYFDHLGKKHVLLTDFEMEGVINFAELREVKNAHGFKQGYMFIVGEKA